MWIFVGCKENWVLYWVHDSAGFREYWRGHIPDQVVRVFLSLHKEGHPESNYIIKYNDGSVEDASANSKSHSGAPCLHQDCSHLFSYSC